MTNKDINLVAFYYARPRPGVATHRAGWMKDPNNIRYDERVEITRGLKKDSAHSKVILNLSQKTVAKNTWHSGRSFDELFKYFFTGYHQYITTVMTQLDAEYFNRILDEMQADIDAEHNDQSSVTQ